MIAAFRKYLPEVISILVFLFFTAIALTSEGCYQGGDNFTRYLLCRYSFDIPYFFLHHWGKPLYILIASPFAQFGFPALKVLNVFLGTSAGYLSCKIVEQLSGKRNISALLLTCFAPMFFLLLNSAFTEILFAFLLALIILLFLKEKFIAGAVILSFLYFVRNEAIIVIPCFVLYLLLNRRFKELPFLLIGFLTYSIIGFFVFDDFLWLVHQNPYNGAEEIYGHGSLFHYVENAPAVFGTPLLILLGLSILILLLKRGSFKSIIEDRSLWLLVFGPAAAYFIFHSFLWWKGLGGALGEPRIMVSIIPLISILAILGFQQLPVSVSLLILLPATFFQIYYPLRDFEIPMSLDEQKKVAKAAADWVGENTTGKIIYYDPAFSYFLGINPFDTSRINQYLPSLEKPDEYLHPGDMVVWDAHFGPNEGRIPLERLMNNNRLQLVKVFLPSVPFRVLGNHNYQICVFRISEKELIRKTVVLRNHNYSGIEPYLDPARLSSVSVSKPSSFILDDKFPYSPGYESHLSELVKMNAMQLSARCKVFLPKDLSKAAGGLVISFEKDGKPISYFIKEAKSPDMKPAQWNDFELKVPVHSSGPEGQIVKVYYWEGGIGPTLVDDLNVEADCLE